MDDNIDLIHLESLIKQNLAYIKSLCSFYRQSEERKDLLSIILEKIWTNSIFFSTLNPDDFRKVLYVVVRNENINMFRRNKYKFEDIESCTETIDVIDNISNSNYSTEILIILKRKISDFDFRVFKLCLEGMKYQEIADLMEIPISKVKIIIHNARKINRLNKEY